jgi:MFS family permease
MEIRFFDPLSAAWSRMVTALFKPFDIGKWFAVGFTAFLAHFMDYGSGGGNFGNKGGDYGQFSLHDFFNLPEVIGNWMIDHPGWVSAIILISIVVLIIMVVLTWIGARGKFMFLDNVVHDRKLVKQPWREYKTQGDSLFLWRLGYLAVLFVIFGFYIWICYSTLQEMYFDYVPDETLITYAVFMILGLLLLIIIAAYISLFVNHFIVPIMYKKGHKAMVAWGHFMALFSKSKGSFLLYGLLVLFLMICVFILAMIFGLLTCCLGFVLLVLPYISSVVTLPISYTFRAFSVEFLEQYGPEYKFFPDEKAEPLVNPET